MTTADETAVVADVPKGLWVGGGTTPATDKAVLPVDDPSTGEVAVHSHIPPRRVEC